MSTVSLAVQSQIYPSVVPQFDVVSEEQRLQQVDLNPITPQPSQLLPETDDDWFLLFDAIRDEAAIQESGIKLNYGWVPSGLILKRLYFMTFACMLFYF